MEKFSEQLDGLLSKPGRSAESVARELRICRASLYNYRNEMALPSFEVLRRAHDLYEFVFPYIDFNAMLAREPRSEEPPDIQGVLPLLRLVRNENVDVIRTKPVERENALELTVKIRFSA